MTMTSRVTLADRVRRLDFPVSERGCIEFTGYTNSDGYGKVKIGGRMWGAHRYSYITHSGAIGDKIVMHTCDNPKCVNPEHLRLGTHQDNTDDKLRKGRQDCPRGSEHVSSKLTEELVASIHHMSALGFELRGISQAVGISKSQVSKVLTGDSWSHTLDSMFVLETR